MKPFLPAALHSAFTFRPASFPAVTARFVEGLLFFVPVCVCVCMCARARVRMCVCTLCLSMSVHILHPRISAVMLFQEILPLSLSSSRSEAVIKGEMQLSRLN